MAGNKGRSPKKFNVHRPTPSLCGDILLKTRLICWHTYTTIMELYHVLLFSFITAQYPLFYNYLSHPCCDSFKYQVLKDSYDGGKQGLKSRSPKKFNVHSPTPSLCGDILLSADSIKDKTYKCDGEGKNEDLGAAN